MIGRYLCLTMVLSQNMPARTKNTLKNLDYNTRCPGRGVKREPPKYKLPLHQAAQSFSWIFGFRERMKFLDHIGNYQLRMEDMKVQNSDVHCCILPCIKIFVAALPRVTTKENILQSSPYSIIADINLLLIGLTNKINTLLSSLVIVNINDAATGLVLLLNSYSIQDSNASSFRQCVCDAYNVTNKQ
jgi:hypothetical protein